MSDTIVNKVAESGLITVNLEDFYPKQAVVVFDLKPYLFMEQILKEKEFRAALQTIDWDQYRNKVVALTCTADAIIPVWAYMLVVTYLEPVASNIFFGDSEVAKKQLFLHNINAMNIADLADKRIVIKGCSDVAIDEFAYIEITKKLRPVAKSIMYGEPCSTVPLYKKSPATKKE